jgi:hypothetical protein
MRLSLQNGERRTEETQREYEELASRLQSGPVYQGVVAAQSNFDRCCRR